MSHPILILSQDKNVVSTASRITFTLTILKAFVCIEFLTLMHAFPMNLRINPNNGNAE